MGGVSGYDPVIQVEKTVQRVQRLVANLICYHRKKINSSTAPKLSFTRLSVHRHHLRDVFLLRFRHKTMQ